MKKFKELTEAKTTIVFAFGRFNPPTTGHEKLIQKTVKVAGSNPYRIFPSHTQNPKKDPLPQALKTAYMRKMFKKYARNIVVSKSRNAIEIAVELYDQGYKNLVMIAGSDRVKVFDAMLNQYNGVEGKAHGYYKFDSIKIVSAGERDPDAEGVEGMSASKMRTAAVAGDMDSFLQGVPSGFADGKKLYRDVRKYMGIREERDMGDMTDFENVRDAYLTGKIWNVGDVIEANGVVGEVVRKGTNYLSFMTENGKIHKAWLHEIDNTEKKQILSYINDIVNQMKSGAHKNLSPYADKFKKDAYKTLNPKKSLDNILPDKVKNKQKSNLLNMGDELDERNYAREYQNYHSRPEQIARRSSRNKARRVMGDKTKIGMDVGHADNDPMNNDPKNLRNEDPSKNRREPRLRGKPELDEYWYDKVMDKLTKTSHPKGWDKMVNRYVELMRTDKYKENPHAAALDVVRQTRNVKARSFITYINKLVAKGVFPKELKAEYEVVEAKSPLQRLRDFDKSRVAVGQKPIFKDKGTKFVRMKKRGQLTIMNVPSDEVDKYSKKGYKPVKEEWSFKDFVDQIQEVKQIKKPK